MQQVTKIMTVNCPTCEGAGYDRRGSRRVQCGTCNGTGVVKRPSTEIVRDERDGYAEPLGAK